MGFNAGDRAFWFNRASYVPFCAPLTQWRDTFEALCTTHAVTDIVLYGDTRPVHATAIVAAKQRGITVHVFEEGYMRPFWVTYERNGSNGNSRLMDMGVAQMQAALAQSDLEAPLPPGHWGDMRQHVFYGALYHWFVMFQNCAYPHFTQHRSLSVTREFQLYVRRLLLMPLLALDRYAATLRVRHGVAARVHYVGGGKLAGLMNHARSAVTVNSTAGQQVLWRGLPLKVFGRAAYNQPEFVSTQRLADFFRAPARPDNKAYKDYRRYLLETSQVPGGFYAASGRTHLLRHVVDMMLATEDPYDAFASGNAAPRQQLRLVT